MPTIGLLTSGRAAIGAGAWIAPRLAGRLFGVNPQANRQLSFVVRLFAVRDLALAAGLQLSSPGAKKLWLQMGILSDAGDGLAAILGARRGELSTASAVLVSAAALSGAGLGIAALQAVE